MKRLLASIILCFLILAGTIIPSANASANQEFTTSELGFKDVSSNYTFYDEVLYLSSEQIISGFTDGTFRADNVVTRAQVAIMIGKALKLNGDPRDTHFTDVTSTVTGSGYIASAVERGIISGFTDGTYRPNQSVTRGQMAIFLNRAYKLTTGQANSFNDVTPNMAAYQSILNVAAEGIASGYADNTYRPDQPVTRGQFSAFMARTLEPSFRSLTKIPKVAWDGNWTNQFGDVSISNETSNSFDFNINVVMGGHVGDINGTASIQGETAVYTEYIDSFEGFFNDPNCRITFTNSGDSIKVKETAACSYWHGMAATFDGTYSATTEDQTKPGMIAELVVNINNINNSILVNGVSLGSSRQDVINKLGNPKKKGYSDIDDSIDYYGYLIKDRNNNQELELDVYFYNNKVESISFDINENIINENWYKDLGKPFTESYGVTYFYLEGTEQILMFKPDENNAHVVYADNNFYYNFGMEDKMW